MVQGAALADFTMISGFDLDITKAIPNGAMVEIDPAPERPFIRVVLIERSSPCPIPTIGRI